MSEPVLKTLLALAMGMGTTVGIVLFVRMLPLEPFMKHILCIVVAIPAVCIALVMVSYGPWPLAQWTEGWGGDRRAMVRTFLAGAGMGAAYLAVATLVRRLLSGDDDDGDAD